MDVEIRWCKRHSHSGAGRRGGLTGLVATESSGILDPVRTLSLTSGTRSFPSAPGGRRGLSRLTTVASAEGEMVPCGRPRDSAYFSSMIEFWSGGEVGFVRRGMEASPSRELTLVFVFFFNWGTGGETERLYRQDLHAWLPSFQPGIVLGGPGGARWGPDWGFEGLETRFWR